MLKRAFWTAGDLLKDKTSYAYTTELQNKKYYSGTVSGLIFVKVLFVIL